MASGALESPTPPTTTPTKAVLISEGSAAFLIDHIAHLPLPKRSLSLPSAPQAPEDFPNFIELWGETHQLRSIVEAWPQVARAWLVREIVPIPYERTWPSGKPSPGVRFLSTIHRRGDLSRQEFEAHWRGPHTEVAKSYTVPVWNYVQNVVVDALGHDSLEDGFVGMHFRTTQELERRWQAYPDEASRGAEDAAKFMDVDRSRSMTATEIVWDEVMS